MNLSDFNDMDANDFYGIENFDTINSIVAETKLDVESVCKKLNMTSEQIDLVKLIYAREFYILGEYHRGDIFLNSVDKSKNKTKRVIKLCSEIRKNKSFYKNRKLDFPRQLVLTAIPRKK